MFSSVCLRSARCLSRIGPAITNQRVDGQIHLPSRRPMDLNASPVCLFRKPAEEVGQTLVEQGFEISLRRAVGVELQEEIVADGWSYIKPLANSRGSGHVVTSDFSGFRPRYPPSTEAQTERSGNHQQITAFTVPVGGFNPSVGCQCAQGALRTEPSSSSIEYAPLSCQRLPHPVQLRLFDR